MTPDDQAKQQNWENGEKNRNVHSSNPIYTATFPALQNSTPKNKTTITTTTTNDNNDKEKDSDNSMDSGSASTSNSILQFSCFFFSKHNLQQFFFSLNILIENLVYA